MPSAEAVTSRLARLRRPSPITSSDCRREACRDSSVDNLGCAFALARMLQSKSVVIKPRVGLVRMCLQLVPCLSRQLMRPIDSCMEQHMSMALIIVTTSPARGTHTAFMPASAGPSTDLTYSSTSWNHSCQVKVNFSAPLQCSLPGQQLFTLELAE